MEKMIDAHIHLDLYEKVEMKEIIENSAFLEALISVSFHLESCKTNLLLSEKYDKVKPAFGFHPEQPLPNENEIEKLVCWMNDHKREMTAVGEVGLPYYLRSEQKVTPYQFGQYIELLEQFIKLAKEWEKPIVLHAVYDDAPMACDLLEKHSIEKVHFHWFKGDGKTIERMIANGYFISVTPDVVYEQEIQQIVNAYPLERIMIETDGPWPFEGPFKGKMTHPAMMAESVKQIAKIKKIPVTDVFRQVRKNAETFFCI
ncbi:TatD family hydrolase [Bacillus methanolicus]|uniref:Mg-dependent deoxyribonuclease n=1 Tax=Bacillus methanolicus (strain MGA3 / ATCC 53907) TaxID=796606 RepID=I3E962_BACMM|nr:TatD family hydrolase [Bacillus methanolicus]AIE60288.1 Mg-dependent deoxyribonuclease [Bacillus methanolicus MGA3]EIJ83033.1 Mg-dependent deoxyribonuclease [Bacillus methanolicus MGA3]